MKKSLLYNLYIAIIFTIITELFLTFYTENNSDIILYGHIFLLLSRLFIYFALIYYTLRKPYRLIFEDLVILTEQLKHKNDDLKIKDTAVSSAINAITLINLDGYITYANNACLKRLGYSNKEEVIGLNCASFLEESEFFILIRNSLRENSSWHGELRLKKKDGNIIDTYLSINYVYSDEGKIITILTIFIDITARKKSELELIKAKKEAEVASQEKSNFLANMSHEIRTPINGILGFLYLLENTNLNTTQFQYLNNIKISTDTLLSVVNDILDVSKIEAGKMIIENINFNLYKVINEAIVPFNITALSKGIELIVDIKTDVPKLVNGDPIRLKQVIINLISNAIKFTDSGYISLNVELLDSNTTKHHLKFTVKDTGIGMKENTLNIIFKPFNQADASSTRKYGGTGLGLTICKSIVELMKGTINVNSEFGQGSIFTFDIFLDSVNEQDFVNLNDEEATKIHDIRFRDDLNILLVEDNEINRAFLTMFFKMHNLKCDIAMNGKEAVEACLRTHYDLVFMDCLMPVMDGYEATENIRRSEVNRYTKIIAMTACAMKGDISKCLEAGMDDYLSKPINFKQLISLIKKHVKS